MTREEAKEKVHELFRTSLTKDNSGKGYVCPICRSGLGKNGTGITTKDGKHYTCWAGCYTNSDAFDIIALQNGLQKGTGEAMQRAYELYNISIDALPKTNTEQKKEAGNQKPASRDKTLYKAAETLTDKADFNEYYKECRGYIEDSSALKYLSYRGISKETADRYYLGYDRERGFIIIPVAKGFYVARNVDPQASKRYSNPAGAKIDLFNANIEKSSGLYNDSGRPVFIVEGAIDALSVIEAGGEAVALNSTGNYKKLLERLKENRTGNTLILALDNDDAGRRASAELQNGLKELNISFITADISAGYKDPNEALTANKGAFIEAVESAERSIGKPDNTADYIAHSMAAEIDRMKKDAYRKTGFENLDKEAGGIYSGLYAVGGISSVGKTTFIHQIADQMAAQGQHVLFFSMEQSRLELVSKSLSRRTAQKDVTKAVTSLAIRTGNGLTPAVLDEADEYVKSVGERISVIEGNFNCNVSFIGEYTNRYIEKNRVKPVVIVDYLQVLQAEKDPDTGRKPSDTKQIVDYNVTALKRISRNLDIPVFVISSVNRSNYLTPIDFEAFKESGGIEYTADVVWGLQLDAINDALFDKANALKEKREKIAEAKEAIPRDIELVCLKNRYGKSRYKVKFTYYPQYDYFKSCAVTSETTAKKTIRI